jgi:riboflavin kinase / FMN adenylyltransferase
MSDPLRESGFYSPPVYVDDRVHVGGEFPELKRGTAVTIGNFDGVHLGHQALLAHAVSEAEARGLTPVALTFEPHPNVVLGRAPRAMLTTLIRKAELLSRLGAVHVFARRFDSCFSAWSPERFVEELLVGELAAKVVVSGKNFRFGRERKGDPDVLASLSRRFGFVALSEETKDGRGPLSSTRAREAIARGDLEEAASILGRRHSVEGRVLVGDRRGRTIGFPTANLDSTHLALPPDGVYAVVVDRVTDRGPRVLARGVMNIGVRPTVESAGARSVEVHLFDLEEDLYGQTLRAHVVRKLREERRFSGLDALKKQIEMDAEEARAVTAQITPGASHAFG